MKYSFLILCVLVFSLCSRAFGQEISLPPQDVERIGEKVFENECSGRDEYLMAWNEGEDFLSLGIGHFIWYPRERSTSFQQGFPRFIAYLKAQGQTVPEWLGVEPFPACPWSSREDFERNRQGRRAVELYGFLTSTKAQQVGFLVHRLTSSLAALLENTDGQERERVKRQFDRLSGTSSGIYALIDYVNFKGLGVSPGERYQGKGWGLLQVLLEMTDEADGTQAVEAFARAAGRTLAERVRNAPPQRDEQRWLPGWQRRVATYLETNRGGDG